MPIDPTDLAKSIGALGTLDPEGDLAPTLQQVVMGAGQLFEADAAGLMLIDAEGQLRWASASDQTAQNVEDSQERLAQGPCAVADGWAGASGCRCRTAGAGPTCPPQRVRRNGAARGCPGEHNRRPARPIWRLGPEVSGG